MVEFAYNNAKKASTGHILFELSSGYYHRVLFKNNVDLYLRSRSADCNDVTRNQSRNMASTHINPLL